MTDIYDYSLNKPSLWQLLLPGALRSTFGDVSHGAVLKAKGEMDRTKQVKVLLLWYIPGPARGVHEAIGGGWEEHEACWGEISRTGPEDQWGGASAWLHGSGETGQTTSTGSSHGAQIPGKDQTIRFLVLQEKAHLTQKLCETEMRLHTLGEDQPDSGSTKR